MLETDDTSERYKKAIIKMLAAAIYAHNGKQADAINEVMRVTGRSRTTVSNWLIAELNLPDLVAFGRLVRHYGIDLGGADMQACLKLLAPSDHAADPQTDFPLAGYTLKSLTNEASTASALRIYTEHAAAAAFIVYKADDMSAKIRRGELVLIDTSIERIDHDGIYLLQRGERTMLRAVRLAAATGEAVVSTWPAEQRASEETLMANADGTLPGLVVHGLMVGVLKA